MPANLYADMAQYRARFLSNNAADGFDESQIELALEGASRMVDRFCNRQFYAQIAAPVFNGTGRSLTTTDYLNYATRQLYAQSVSFLRLPDCLAVTAAALDQDGDRVFETALSPATDYYLLNEYGDNQDAPPFDRFQLDSTNGTVVTSFSSRPRLLQLTGRWGYTEATVADAIGATATTATLADAMTTAMTTNQAGGLARGQTLLLGSEQVYVAAGGGTTWTVTRAQNGTTGAAHTSAAVSRYVYVPQVREATLIMAARLWSRRRTAYTAVVSQPGLGSFSVYGDVDPDVKAMLFSLVRRNA